MTDVEVTVAEGGASVRPKPRRSWARRLALGVALLGGVAALASIVCRAAFGWVFPISSGSMEPTIMTGESVFLLYGSQSLEPFDIVAFRDEASGAAIKRVVALGGDQVMVNASGDLRINEAFVPDAPGRPAPTVIFDSRLQPIEGHWRHGGTAFDPWTAGPRPSESESEVWTLDGTVVERGADLGLLRFSDRVTDGALDENGEYHLGPNAVHDVIVEFEVRVLEPGGYLRVEMVEQNDLFTVSVPVYSGTETERLDLRRIRPRAAMNLNQSPVVLLGSAQVSVPVDEWVPVRMSNVDNRIQFEIGDVGLVANYDANTPRMDPRFSEGVPVSIGERVKIGANRMPIQVRNIRVLRDFHVVAKGRFANGQTLTLLKDEIFVLGDASSTSEDSRERGPVKIDRVIGKAKAVVRPLGRFRWL